MCTLQIICFKTTCVPVCRLSVDVLCVKCGVVKQWCTLPVMILACCAVFAR